MPDHSWGKEYRQKSILQFKIYYSKDAKADHDSKAAGGDQPDP
jgi:hypothetical protein